MRTRVKTHNVLHDPDLNGDDVCPGADDAITLGPRVSVSQKSQGGILIFAKISMNHFCSRSLYVSASDITVTSCHCQD